MDPATANVSSLQCEDGAKLLDDIDKLRSHGISRFVSLPQIIVVGDQSSGKSSVLEAISGVAFPTSDGLCTRFATEVILRRSKDEKASVRIRPSSTCAPERRAKLENFHQIHIALTQVSGLVSEATKVMGIADHVSFSEDILELEISGPKLPHLTLVDLPGIFHSTTAKQSEGDPALVTNLVRSYMEKQRSIILAVISAKYDYAVQQILGMLKSVDPKGSRTMGIITKPDAIEPNSADEQTYLSLARNTERPLKLGWHVLRNPSFTERRDVGFDRDSTEEHFFAKKAPWNTLPSSHVGVASLRLRLSRLLFDHITSELPELLTTIESEITACQSILNDVGPERRSSQDQRVYLIGIAERFQRLAEDGVEGLYRDEYYAFAAGHRLRAKVQKAHEDFAKRMKEEGQRWLIKTKPGIFRGSLTPGLVLPPDGPAREIDRDVFIDGVRGLLVENRGRELPGNYNPLIVRELFQIQSVSWERLSYRHARDVLDSVRVFVEDLTEHVAGDERAEVLLNHLIDPAVAKMQERLEAKVAELLNTFTKGYPMTLNPDYVAAFAKLNGADQARLEKLGDDQQRLSLLACSRLVDCMECYYKVALRVFMDNVAALAIENCVLNNIEKLISPAAIAKMSDEELKLLASESPDVTRMRQQTLEKQTLLQEGLETCRKYARRKPGLPRAAKNAPEICTGAPIGAASVSGLSPSRSVTPAGLSPRTPATRPREASASRSGPEVRSASDSPPTLLNISSGFSASPAGPGSLFGPGIPAKEDDSKGLTFSTAWRQASEGETPPADEEVL